MSVPSLQSMCLSEMVRTNQWNNLGVNQKDILFSEIANQDNTELFFTVAQQLDLSQQSTKQIYLTKLKSILKSFQNNQSLRIPYNLDFNRRRFLPVALSIVKRAWKQGFVEDVEDLRQESNKSLLSRKFSRGISEVSFCGILLVGASLVGGIASSIDYYCYKMRAGKYEWERYQSMLRPILDLGIIKIYSVLTAVFIALYGISKITIKISRRLSDHKIKSRLTEKLTNIAENTVNPTGQINVAKDRALITFMQRNLS